MKFKFPRQYTKGLLIILGTWFLFFIPILSGKYVYFLDDLKIIYYPLEILYAQFQHAWNLPLWATEFGFGHPLLAWGQLGFFTPLHVLLRALYVPALALLQISVVSYFLFGSIGMFIFGIRRGFDQYAAALGAVVFAYCGFMVGHLNHVNFYTSTMLLPWLLIGIDMLIEKPTLKRATTLALIASAIAMSGQPQVVLYVFIIATIIALVLYIRHLTVRKTLLVIYAGLVAFTLSSLAILPLQEFLPQTERAAGLPREELFEFSYPPFHAITLISPYFFGDHENYWGPKGFQELAAFVGIIPLILAGGALTSWKRFRAERVAGILLVTLGILLVLGRYSFLYQFLVDHHYITTIGVVGRFVFFFDVGIALLAAIGLVDLMDRRLRLYFGALLPLLMIGIPFGMAYQQNSEIQERFNELWSFQNIEYYLIAIGVLAIPLAGYFKQRWILPILAALTLVAYGWDYNPRTPTSQVTTNAAILQTLAEYRKEKGYPARVYAAEHLPINGNPQSDVFLSDPISPVFSVYQPILSERKPFDCIIVPIQADSNQQHTMTITVQSGFNGTVWYHDTISSEELFKDPYQHICFSSVPQEARGNLLLSFTSNEDTNLKVFTTRNKSDAASLYFVRKQNPTSEQLAQSKKQLSVSYEPDFPKTEDLESSLLVRHLQAAGGASSARWIGALSVRPYREFIDSFFANDADTAFDGDGVHALARNKKLVDFVGITHFIQGIEYGQTNDPMLDAGYTLVQETDTGDSLIRLYENPTAFPKVFVVPNAEFVPADDEIRFKMRSPNYDPTKLLYLSGPAPLTITKTDTTLPLEASTYILRYEQTRVDVQVTTNQESYLVLGDTTDAQWQTFIDEQPAQQFRADTIFKAAQVPPGNHIISFRYSSPATHRAIQLAGVGILIVIGAYAYSIRWHS
jgi:hypothetical protein